MRCVLTVAPPAVADPLERRLRLHSSVSLRPERFGALAYSFDTRKLSFIKHPDLLRVVESLDGERTIRGALDAAGVDEARWPSFVAALATLETSEMLEPVDATSLDATSLAATSDLLEHRDD